MRHVNNRLLNIVNSDVPMKLVFGHCIQRCFFSRKTSLLYTLQPLLMRHKLVNNITKPLHISRSFNVLSPLLDKYTKTPPQSRPAQPSLAIKNLATQGRAKDALSCYLKLIEEGGYPSQEAIYQLIRILNGTSDLYGMFAVHDTLISYYKIHPPSVRTLKLLRYAYTMLINMIANHTAPTDIDTILKLCREMAILNVSESVVLYNTLIKAYLRDGHISKAEQIYDEMIKQKLTPSTVTFIILLHDASRRKDIPRLLSYMDQMDRYSIPVDYGIVSIITSTLCDLRQYQLAAQLVNKINLEMNIHELISNRYRQQLIEYIEKRRLRSRRKRRKKTLKVPL
ncbi:hypothetical protein BDB01DRAFT_773122 [Pilobolus umbonatus]|nr:hypothetical protein BDB01DRAFT_773122 [Pilobolus umbonatus]